MHKLPPIANSLVTNLSDLMAMSEVNLDIPFRLIQESAFTQLVDLYEIGNLTNLQLRGLDQEIQELVGDTLPRTWSANTMLYLNILASLIAEESLRKRKEGVK